MAPTASKKSFLIGLISLICISSFCYWLYNQFYISTDDAYVNANVVQVSARVSGQVQKLYVSNNEYVKAGQLLFELDPDNFVATVAAQQSSVDLAQAKLKIAQITADRTLRLLKSHNASKQDADTTIADLESAQAELGIAQANLNKAQLELKYSKVFAQTDGWVTNITLREGDTVSANQPNFALISDGDFWVDANFKETELAHIPIGYKADVIIDMYPHHHFKGVVASISGGSGSAFSLLPPENATGNWVKVTQRVPVRIHIENPDKQYPLRVGTSSNVIIHLKPWSSKT